MSKRVLIIGGSGSLGGAVALACRSAGHGVVGTSRQAGSADWGDMVQLDVMDMDQWARLAREQGKFDWVVFAQGVRPSKNLRETSASHIQEMLNTHVTAVLLGLQALRDSLNPGGCVLLFSSVAVRKGSYDASYAAAKGAVAALTTSLSKELFQEVRVNCISPGLVEGSPVHQSMTESHASNHSTRMFGGRLIQLRDLGALALEVMSNEGINGAVIPIDGGYQ